jgi:hypothetical protein
MLAIVAKPEDVNPSRYAAEGIDVTVIVASADNRHQVVCELVSHIRRVRPQVVLTLTPGITNGQDVGQLATTATFLAADVRYGHTCTSRGAHTVSKLYYVAPDASGYACVLSTVDSDANHVDDLFAGLRDSTGSVPKAA